MGRHDPFAVARSSDNVKFANFEPNDRQRECRAAKIGHFESFDRQKCAPELSQDCPATGPIRMTAVAIVVSSDSQSSKTLPEA